MYSCAREGIAALTRGQAKFENVLVGVHGVHKVTNEN
jgi:hypothetical protein